MKKLYPATLNPIIDALDAGINESYLRTYTQVREKNVRLKRLRLALVGDGLAPLLAWFLIWNALTALVVVGLRLGKPQSPLVGAIAFLILLGLQPLGQFILHVLKPKRAMTDLERRDHSTKRMLVRAGGMERAIALLNIAERDLEGRDRMLGWLLNTIVIGALINVSVNNTFVQAIFTGRIWGAWNASYVGTICLVAMPFLGFAWLIFASAPRNWIRILRRHLSQADPAAG